MGEPTISYQLYSARHHFPVDAVLKTLASIGYEAVEPYGPVFESDPRGFKRRLNDVGLACPTIHMALRALEADRAACFQTAHLLGVETVIAPFLAPHERPGDSAGWSGLAERLAELARSASIAGLRFAWHNHDFEYRLLPDGSRPIDILLSAPGVCWEADVGWATRAQANPRDELSRYRERVAALHAKDVASPGVTGEDGWADVGFGVVDWEGLWPFVEQANVATIVVEHDNPADWRNSARRSFATLSKLIARSKV